QTSNGYLFEQVLEKASRWGSPDNLMFVVGATQSAMLKRIRLLTPKHFYLVPGIGVQGGDLAVISKEALTPDAGLLVNASRSIIYASDSQDFAGAAARAAEGYCEEMKKYLH
ncbi:MAG TPA: hypothetical protein VK543_07465, partial [Puia sp.]|nr:hypothetical protein [Puia sp.]